MEFADYFCYGIFWLVIIAFAAWWIRARSGLDKRWFVVQAWPVVSSSFYFFLPSFVIGFAIFLIGALLVILDPNDDNALFFFGVTFGLWILGFLFAFLEPGWMSPAWYRWLTREHGDIMPYLVMDAHEMGRQAWMQRVETREGLEEWAEEVRHKYTL